MSIDTETSNIRMIQALTNAGLKTGGYSEVISDLQAPSQNLLSQILDNWDELYFEFISEETNFAVEIGASRPQERKLVIQTISEIVLKNPNVQNMQLLTLINQELNKRNISYRLPISLAPNLSSIAKKSVGIIRGLFNLKLINKKFLIEEIQVLLSKDLNKSGAELKQLADNLRNTLTEMGQNASNPEFMQKKAIETLLRIGYLRVGVEGKDPGQLANVLFYEMVAAQGCLNAKNIKKSETITKNDAIDQVAIILVRTLR